jgi:hypothetical protein
LFDGDPDNRIWLGLTDTRVEGTFMWIDGEPFGWYSYQNGRAGEPNDYLGGEDCAELEGGGIWNDQDCTRERTVMCEFSVLLLSDICSGVATWCVAQDPGICC